MNQIDIQLHRALTFYANNTIQKINYIASKKPKIYRKYVSLKIERYVMYSNYINVDNKSDKFVYAINENGLSVLRHLDDIRLKLRNFIATVGLSVIAIIISVTSLVVK